MSYDRLLQLTSDIGNGVCERFEAGGVVSLITSSAFDNVDNNPTSTTAKNAIHCTGISDPSEGHDRGVVVIPSSSSTKTIAPLPTSYTMLH